MPPRAGDIVVSRANGTQETYLIAELVHADNQDGLTWSDPQATVGRQNALKTGFERRRVGRLWLFDGPEAEGVHHFREVAGPQDI